MAIPTPPENVLEPVVLEVASVVLVCVVVPETVNAARVDVPDTESVVKDAVDNVSDPVTVNVLMDTVENVLVPCTFIPFPMYTIPATPNPPFKVKHPEEVELLAVLLVILADDKVQAPVDAIVLKLLVPVTVKELTVVPAKEVAPVAVNDDRLVVPDTVNPVAVVVFKVDVPVADSVVIVAVGAVRVVIVAVDNVLFPVT